MTFMPFGPLWQKHRKLLQSNFSNSNVQQWCDLQVTEARLTVERITGNPENWEQSLRRQG